MIPDNDVARRIAKLLALATTDNEHEARLAAERASELLLRHNLTMQDVSRQVTDYTSDEAGASYQRMGVAARFINSLVNRFFFVKLVHSRKQEGKWQTKMYGTRLNVEVAGYMHAFLSREFPACWEAYRKRTGATANAKSTYYYGLYEGLTAQLTVKRQSVQTETGLVVVKDQGLEAYVSQVFPKLVKGRNTKAVIRDNGVRADGRSDGEAMRLRRAMGQTSQSNGLALVRG